MVAQSPEPEAHDKSVPRSGLTHHQVVYCSVVEHKKAKSRDQKFDTLWSSKIFPLSHARSKLNLVAVRLDEQLVCLLEFIPSCSRYCVSSNSLTLKLPHQI